MRTVFTTLTYPQNRSIRQNWLNINKDTNRYVQRVRRTIDACDYLKAYEVHQSGHPHTHILFIFKHYDYPSNNSRWLPTDVFKKLKSAWIHGLSDHQQPLTSSSFGSLKYILKYVSKGSDSKLWQNLLPFSGEIPPPITNELGYPIKKPAYAKFKLLSDQQDQTLLYSTFKWNKIKLLSWSRNFAKEYLSTQTT